MKKPDKRILTDSKMNEKNKSKIMYRTINTWIDIEAPPEDVWKVLVDFDEWKSWNPFIPFIEGDLQMGEKIRIRVTPPGLRPMTFRPEVYLVIPYKKIVWGGTFLWIVYRGDHSFLMESIPGGKTRFRQIERFMGAMVLFMGGMIKKTELGYHQMNLALKKKIESNK